MKFNRFFAPNQDVDSCCSGDTCEHDEEMMGLEEVMEDSEVIEIVDEETGETYLFYLVDEFDFEDDMYSVLMTREEPYEYLIARVEDEDGESYLVSLEEDEEDRVYDFYEEILDQAMDEDLDDEA